MTMSLTRALCSVIFLTLQSFHAHAYTKRSPGKEGTYGTSFVQKTSAVLTVSSEGAVEELDSMKAFDPTKDHFDPTRGRGGNLSATDVCIEDSYTPSHLEEGFSQNANLWTRDPFTLCYHLEEWVTENLAGGSEAGPKFSRICKQGQPVQVIEPLAGILRDPRLMCPNMSKALVFSIDWLVLADSVSTPMVPESKRYFFDAGGSRFMDAMNFFTTKYKERGLVFDHVYVWEARKSGTEAYWAGVPAATRAFWEPRITFYDGVPVTADPADKENNPVNRIHQQCADRDFCAFKLDIDTPSVELPIVQQLIVQSNATKTSLDEFFFEHHVHGLMQLFWGQRVNGTFADSYHLFTQLRELGVRAHSWI